ncbi:LacI family DNA-binding transcriptional regulator [Ohessyouella blattaphilus]|uniref:LacI family transcriptional regulator n=1 Tax=Ohessyouella blattaphilus TaxID=2949333 RepID=A0ABT1EI36_9FIRM|nr:LacI family DNA-binding transcriptional regulator [Ohessyouella blattaphilus]MCP1110363.1 LacI family transcriptional regulator [Ohessyouella blattaphilus]MCR8563757.1 LacI family transcriptional regulator [Ohessyouella blattaphilus]
MNIYDIAEKSGVSIATISRVLNGGKNVSQKTYDKVMAIIEEEGYTPNIFARGLGLDTMQTIGILVTDAKDTYYARMISYLSEGLHSLGFNVLLSSTGYDLKSKKREMELLISKRVDAIFLAGSSQQELKGNTHIKEAAKTIPIIMVNGYIDAPGIINVSSNDRAGIYDCIRKLSASGYQKPLYFYNHATYSGAEKIAGFEAAAKELGLAKVKERIIQLPDTLTGMQARVEQVIASGLDFDAVVASEDLLAVAASKALAGRKLDLPVVGFNNSILAEVSSPTLTSIDNMLESLCKMAVELFHERSLGKDTSSRVTIDCKLAVRESFRPEE